MNTANRKANQGRPPALIVGILVFQFVIFPALLVTNAHSQLIHNLKEIVNSSDVIVVATIQGKTQLDVGTAVVSGNTMPMIRERATLAVCERLKGDVPTVLNVEYPLLRPAGGWTGGLPRDYAVFDSMHPNSERLVFLKKVADDQYSFTDLGGQSIELGAGDCNSTNSPAEPYQKVISALTSVVTGDAPTNTKAMVVMQLGNVESPDVLPALHALARQSPDPLLRMRAVTSILLHKDDSVLETAEQELLDTSYPWGGKTNLLVAIRDAVPPDRSIPILAKGLKVPEAEVRTRAAEALYGTNSLAAIEPLLGALEDPSKDVQFAVMQGLGNLTRQYEWRPQPFNPDATWNDCLNHWREFRQTYITNAAKRP